MFLSQEIIGLRILTVRCFLSTPIMLKLPIFTDILNVMPQTIAKIYLMFMKSNTFLKNMKDKNRECIATDGLLVSG
jgi:hypothetical protein